MAIGPWPRTDWHRHDCVAAGRLIFTMLHRFQLVNYNYVLNHYVHKFLHASRASNRALSTGPIGNWLANGVGPVLISQTVSRCHPQSDNSVQNTWNIHPFPFLNRYIHDFSTYMWQLVCFPWFTTQNSNSTVGWFETHHSRIATFTNKLAWRRTQIRCYTKLSLISPRFRLPKTARHLTGIFLCRSRLKLVPALMQWLGSSSIPRPDSACLSVIGGALPVSRMNAWEENLPEVASRVAPLRGQPQVKSANQHAGRPDSGGSGRGATVERSDMRQTTRTDGGF